MRKWYTPDELAFLNKYAHNKTGHWLSKNIEKVSGYKRSLKSIQYKLGKMMLADQVPDGYVRPHWLRSDAKSGKLYATVVKQAQRDGVLKRQKHSLKRQYIVPQKWLDKYLAERERGAHGYKPEEMRETWLTTSQIAHMVGATPQNFCGILTCSRVMLGRIFDRKVRRWTDPDAPGKKKYWHPDDARVALTEWWEYKRTKAMKNPKHNLLHNHANSTINEEDNNG